MTTGTVIAKGIIHGKTIELDRAPGLPEGEAVSVIVRPALPPGEGLKQAFGAWREDAAGLDEFLQTIYRDREDNAPGATP